VPAPKKSSSLVPLLIVGAIVTVLLMAGAAAAIMIVLMNRGAFSPAGPAVDALPAADAPADAPVEAPPDAAPASDTAAPPAAEIVPPEPPPVADGETDAAAPPPVPNRERTRGSTREPAGPPREAAAERERRATVEDAEAADEPVVRPLRVGGTIRSPRKTRDVLPVYPQIAQQARVQGVVIIEATIDRDGRVSEARVLRSIPLLDQAALDAVRQWEYEPTLLNGVAVPVIVTVTANFTLGR
jgi:protein TonB